MLCVLREMLCVCMPRRQDGLMYCLKTQHDQQTPRQHAPTLNPYHSFHFSKHPTAMRKDPTTISYARQLNDLPHVQFTNGLKLQNDSVLSVVVASHQFFFILPHVIALVVNVDS